MKVTGCKHYETKVIKMAEGGSVPAKKQVLKTKTMKDGSQQYTRGDTSSERLGTISNAIDTAVKDYRAADAEVEKNYGKPGFRKAMDDSKRKFNGRMQLGKAFLNELDDE